MNCSIVIRAYNEAQHLPRLLEGIHRQTVKDVEIILVDSGSTDGTEAIVKRFDFARFEAYRYSDHCAAYNDVCTTLATSSSRAA